MMIPQWHGGSAIGGVYEYQKADRDRIGDCRFIPRAGDLCVCEEHSGDYFYDYVAFRKQADGTLKRVGAFSAYNFGELRRMLSNKAYHLACAGIPWKQKKGTQP